MQRLRLRRHEVQLAQVLGLRLKGMDIQSICQVLNFQPQFVEQLVRELEERAREIAVVPDPYLVIGKKLQRLRRLQEEVLMNAESETGLVKNALINTALRCEDMETKLLQDSSLLPKVAEKLEHALFQSSDGLDLRKVGPDELRKLVVAEQKVLMEMVEGEDQEATAS